MKTRTSRTFVKLTAALTGALIASAAAFAQTEAPAPAQVAPAYAGEVSLVMPKAAPSPNFYLEATGISMFTKAKLTDYYGDSTDNDTFNFLGGSLTFGYRFNKNNKVAVEAGALFASKDYHYYYTDGSRDTLTVDCLAMPLLASYSYCIPLTHTGNWELRITPALGYQMMRLKLKEDGISVEDTQGSFVYGGGAGVTFHINKYVYIDFGYRYLHADSKTYKFTDSYEDSTLKLSALNTHSFTASFGWKF